MRVRIAHCDGRRSRIPGPPAFRCVPATPGRPALGPPALVPPARVLPARGIPAWAVLALLFSSGPAPAIAADGPAAPDSLWLRALAIAATGDSTLPGLIDAQVDQIDSEGRVENGKQTIARLSMGPDGKIEHHLVREIMYGKDRDSTEVADESGDGRDEKEKKQQFSMRIGETPLSQKDGVKIEARSTGERRSIDEAPCVGYAFIRTEAKRTTRGIAWIAESTGVPVEIEFRERPLPKHVKSMSTVARFANDTLGWRMTQMEINAIGGFLFVKKRFHVVTTFSDHWRLKPGAATASAPPTPAVSPTPSVPGIPATPARPEPPPADARVQPSSAGR